MGSRWLTGLGDLGLVLAEHHAQDVFERRIFDREVGGLERAEQLADDGGDFALGDAQGDALAVAGEQGAEAGEVGVG